MQFEPFHPPWYLSHAYTQTLLASLKLRTLGSNPLVRFERHVILDTESGARLSGYYTPRNSRDTKGLAVLLHGWEGSARSTYMLMCGKHLYQNGYAVFRLNFRDHGHSHHLNKGLFYATLLDEVFEGVHLATRLCSKRPAVLVGFSLGGNFAIRIAAMYSAGDYDHLVRAVSISPVLDPEKSTNRIDRSPLILAYFLKKWRNSLRRKQHYFPSTYHFNDILKGKTILGMTDQLIQRYSNYTDSHEYFSGYRIHSNSLENLTLPLTIIAAADDPIIPVDDFYAINPAPGMDLIIHPRGGHNGFIEGIYKPAWYERYMVDLFK
jgi:predicted alpha/beta-fold hydrolase